MFVEKMRDSDIEPVFSLASELGFLNWTFEQFKREWESKNSLCLVAREFQNADFQRVNSQEEDFQGKNFSLEKSRSFQCAGFQGKSRSFQEENFQGENFSFCKAGDQTLLGFAIYHLLGEESELLAIAVSKEKTRRGVGSLLWKAGEEALFLRGAKTLFLEVRETNASARAFYERMSAKPLTIRKRYYSDGENAVIYQKNF